MAGNRNKRQPLSDLPPLSLNIQNICKKSELQGKYCIESEVKGISYVYDSGVLNVITGTRGYVSINEELVESIACELLDIVDEIRELKKIRKLGRKGNWVFNDR